jgi:hypothetical protein
MRIKTNIQNLTYIPMKIGFLFLTISLTIPTMIGVDGLPQPMNLLVFPCMDS